MILGGAFQHEKLVEAAKDLGAYTVVIDNKEDSSAKKIADKSFTIDIYDINALLRLCASEGIDGVISTSLDPCQNPYSELCEKAGYFCYGTREQFCIMTNKSIFKKLCEENGVNVITDFNLLELDFCKESSYPIIVKPVDSRGSRGQTICYSVKDVEKAVKTAKNNSISDQYIIEKYIENGFFFQVTYFCVNSKPYLIRTVDGYCGSKEKGLDRVVSCAVSPSRFTAHYIKTAHNDILRLIKALGIINGPIFMQGLVKDQKFYFFDPGLRFPGVDYERIYKKVYGTDLMGAMVNIALDGNCNGLHIPEDSVWLSGKRAAILFPFLRPGIIGRVLGEEEVVKRENVVSYLPRYKNGEEVPAAYDISRRHSEIDILSDSTEKLKRDINNILSILKVEDKCGNNMLCDEFDTSIIL